MATSFITGRRCRQQGVGDSKALDGSPHRAEINRFIKISGHGVNASRKDTADLLVSVAAAGGILPHGISIHDINMRVLSSANSEVMHGSGIVGEVQHHKAAARAEVLIMRVFKSLIGLLKIIRYRKAPRRGKFQEGIAEISLAGESAGIECRVERAVAIEKINVAGRIRCESSAAHPDGAFRS